MTVCLCIVMVELVGTVTQLSVMRSCMSGTGNHFSPKACCDLPRSNVKGSLATRTMSAPLSRLSILYRPVSPVNFQVVPLEKYRLAAASVLLLTYLLQTTLCPSATAKLRRLMVSIPSSSRLSAGMAATKALIRSIVFRIALLSTACPNPFLAHASSSGSWPSFSRQSRKRAKAHSLSVLPCTPLYHLSPTASPSSLFTCFHPAIPPLCIHIRLLWEKGWQLASDKLPSVVART